MRLYCPAHLVDEIIIVDNSTPDVWDRWQEKLLQQYGRLANLVRFVPSAQLATMTTDIGGWWTQQVLKIKVAEIIRSERYVLLDAKNHLFSPLRRDFLETAAAQPRINGHSYIKDSMRKFLECTLGYLGVDPGPHLDWFTRTTTPFTMLATEARDLARYLDAREGDTLALAFQEKKLTEFFLYSGFLVSKGILTSVYDLTQPWCAQIWGETANEAGCAEAVRKAEGSDCPFMAVHSKAITNMDRKGRATVANFWHARGLFPSANDGIRFLCDPNRSYQSYSGRVLPWPMARLFGRWLNSHKATRRSGYAESDQDRGEGDQSR